MAASTIEWTDRVWNPVRGCVKVSAGCKNCYAETFAERWRGVKGHAYEQGFDLRLVPEKLKEPLYWKKPSRVFVNSMSDLFQEGVPDEFIDRIFRVMRSAENHTFQVLTKRANRMCNYMRDRMKNAHGIAGPFPPRNVWLGVSVENQETADERILLLLQTPAAVRFVSYEPALGPVDFEQSIYKSERLPESEGWGLNWIIVGGESGPGARPCSIAWIRSVVEQCRESGTACFVKQVGSKPYDWAGIGDAGVGVKKCRDPKGGDMREWPAYLRVRQWPEI